MRAYLIDEGILLSEDNEEFEKYATVYDEQYGYYDENQYYVKEEQNAIQAAKAYVEAGVENTYAIVSNTDIPYDYDFNNGYVEGEKYDLRDVIYSVAKINGEIVENFLITCNESCEEIKVVTKNGYLSAMKSGDINYPGIDIEFIPDNEDENALSRPRVLFEYPTDGKLRVLVWADKDNEDYTQIIEIDI